MNESQAPTIQVLQTAGQNNASSGTTQFGDTAHQSAPPAPLTPTPPIEPAATAAPVQPADDGSYQRLAVGEVNFDVRHAFSSGPAEFDPKLPIVQYPSASRAATGQAISRAPNVNLTAGAKLEEYATVLREGLAQIPMGDDMDELRGRPQSHFAQVVSVNGEDLQGYVPKFKLRENVKYTGEAARNLVRDSLKLGTVFQAPLWHSGFWVALKSPSEGDLIELHRQLTQEKVMLGRATYGLLYSQLTGYTAKVMSDFILAHLHSTSIKLEDNESILDYIKAADYNILLWALVCATWPNGYQYQRACVSDVEKCNHVVTERVNLSRLLWTDTSSLTQRQMQHMTNRQRSSVTPEQVQLYCDDFLRGKNTKVALNNKVQVTLRMPSLNEYIEASYRWIGMIEESYGRAMSMEENERNQYLLNHAQAQGMRQFSHFVQSIVVDDHEIDDQETVEQILGDVSCEDDVRDAFTEQVQKFQSEGTISFVGIPNYKCPSCNGMQRPSAIAGQKHELIVLDVAQSFFPLLMQKLTTIRAR